MLAWRVCEKSTVETSDSDRPARKKSGTPGKVTASGSSMVSISIRVSTSNAPTKKK